MGPLDTTWQGILPCPGTVSTLSPWLGGLTAFIRAVQQLRQKMRARYQPRQWATLLLSLVDDFLAYGEESEEGEEHQEDEQQAERQRSCPEAAPTAWRWNAIPWSEAFDGREVESLRVKAAGFGGQGILMLGELLAKAKKTNVLK